MLIKIKVILILILFSCPCFPQMIEASSRPYRFYIDKILNFEGKSESSAFEIIPFRTRIINELETEIAYWYEVSGYKYENDEDFEEKITAELEKMKPRIINEVGAKVMSTSTPELFFIPEELKFTIQFNGFEPFQIEVPIEQIEDFKLNFYRIKYMDQQIAFNDLDQFVFTEINVYDPVLDALYVYQRDEQESISPPVFDISIPRSN